MYVGDLKRRSEIEITMPGGETITLFYRDPKPDEVRGYNSESVQRKGNKIVMKHSQTQEKYGLKILEGIKEGDFGIKGPDGKPVCVSSDDSSKFYRQDWKTIFCEYALTAVIALGAAIFGGTEASDRSEEVGETSADQD